MAVEQPTRQQAAAPAASSGAAEDGGGDDTVVDGGGAALELRSRTRTPPTPPAREGVASFGSSTRKTAVDLGRLLERPYSGEPHAAVASLSPTQ
ncbi:hypothetical protein OsJ_30619 [Oryza sativa Japonica Group]|uniref:Uncharacterized protein n=2 Tax=Oryza sativa subsp. japonica TaxID=39947 RepID=Q7G5D4_ORYSJ|nr:Hypothetical protein [Oryza sativa Japonica Group]AAM47625.1 Hypothetical protein [Oryza sativa Japonica Group]AAP51992.1 hypothetical protein LOC_Os10g04100 [Oryza sativa Japonica Group]EAZ15200.1 hypothetical protein OsJ_30619 [Oryza sativa Japonica Group]